MSYSVLKRLFSFWVRGPSEWLAHDCFFYVTTIDGQRMRGWLMRRRTPDGSWQYRTMNAKEIEDVRSILAW